jgi:hypothetical protein
MIAMTGSLPNSDLVSNNLTDGQVVRNATLHILLAAMRVMSRSTGVIRVETKYHRWKLLLTGGGLVLAAHVTQKPKKVSETAIPSEIAAKP